MPVNWEAFRIAEGILPEVFAASHSELDAAGWGEYPRKYIPRDWATRKPRNPNFYPPRQKQGGGKPRKHFTEEALQAAAKESRIRYEQRHKAMLHQTRQAQERAAYQRAKQTVRAMQRDFDKNRKSV